MFSLCKDIIIELWDLWKLILLNILNRQLNRIILIYFTLFAIFLLFIIFRLNILLISLISTYFILPIAVATNIKNILHIYKLLMIIKLPLRHHNTQQIIPCRHFIRFHQFRINLKLKSILCLTDQQINK